jgi:glycerophosphoryl diester phosphodiesterase
MTGVGSEAGTAMLDKAVFLRPMAHRGLHVAAKGIIENTALAFQAAIAKGYGIECDLQSAADGTPFVFHDATLDRLMDATGPVAARSPANLATLHYKDQKTRILSFAEFLSLVAGRVPMLVEVKNAGGPPRAGFLEKIAEQAAAYAGPIALMSFDAAFVASLGKLAPTIPRGLITGVEQLPSGWQAMPAGADKQAALDALLGAAPDGVAFHAVDVKMLPEAAAWMARRPVRLPLFSWTIRTPAQREVAARWADAPIFETYEP